MITADGGGLAFSCRSVVTLATTTTTVSRFGQRAQGASLSYIRHRQLVRKSALLSAKMREKVENRSVWKATLADTRAADESQGASVHAG
jgi:hypothetical protein